MIMNGITLSKSSWHRTFYEYWWDMKASDNLCNYFWGFILAVLTLPLFIGQILYKLVSEHSQYTPIVAKLFLYVINTAIVVGVSAAIGLVIGDAIYHPVIALAFLGGLTFIILVVLFFVWLWNGTKFVENVIEVGSMTSAAVKAKKNKVCPKIEWE